MKIGYPCINTRLYTPNRTLRLSSYSERYVTEIIQSNLSAIKLILEFNIKHNLLFFRIGSSVIPFGSHKITRELNWVDLFKDSLKELSDIIKQNKIRISMHPDQFVVLNSPDKEIVETSIREAEYHVRFLDSLELDSTAKVQLHVGGRYDDKELAIQRFISVYSNLNQNIKNRLVIENDDRVYSIKDCYKISEEINIPIVFDTLHYQCLNDGESILKAIDMAFSTWKSKDGLPMVDYSNQDPKGKKGKHASTINTEDFKKFIEETKEKNFDIMIEIKDKQESAFKALSIATSIRGF